MKSLRALAGEVELVQLDDGTPAVRKRRRAAPAEFFAAEAHGLEWLRETGTIRVPRVLGVGSDFLLLEWLEGGDAGADGQQRLGRALAALHRFPAGEPGLGRPNFVGALPQDNRPCALWCEFFVERRLRPLAFASPAPARWRSRFERLFERLPELLPDEPLSRLHGDLWGGNALFGPGGEPCLIDPAVYVGHREVDLAMMRLFGGFGPGVWSAYEASYPLAPGWQSRVPLYQLYPLLVHVHMFGGSYLAQVERALEATERLR